MKLYRVLHAGDERRLHKRSGIRSIRLIDATNLHIAETTPWSLAKDPSKADRLTRVLFDAAEAIRLAAVLLSPIILRQVVKFCVGSRVIR